mmetsp:Transcript_127485/g.254713  ORF Transcript_127485/g.254713 Transcript_127485/m.254713 type:complete len:322 (+) Transcript_127485:35-1000(+)
MSGISPRIGLWVTTRESEHDYDFVPAVISALSTDGGGKAALIYPITEGVDAPLRRIPGIPLQNLEPFVASTSEIEELEDAFLGAVRQSRGTGRPAVIGASRALCGCSTDMTRENMVQTVLLGAEALQAQARLALRSYLARSRTPKHRSSEQCVAGCCKARELAIKTRNISPLPKPQLVPSCETKQAHIAAPCTPPRGTHKVETFITPQKTRRTKTKLPAKLAGIFETEDCSSPRLPQRQKQLPMAKLQDGVCESSATGDSFAQAVAREFSCAGGPDCSLDRGTLETKLQTLNFSAAEIASGLRRLDDMNKVMIMEGIVYQV